MSLSSPASTSLGSLAVLGHRRTTAKDLYGALRKGKVLREWMVYAVLDSLLQLILQRLQLQSEMLDLLILVCQKL